MKKCVVIGGGVIGLSSAYYLAKSGHQVTVLDSSDLSDGCSYGNAGYVSPSHVTPMAQPGMISQGIKWMLNSKSPFYIHPRLSKELFSWGRSFYRHSTNQNVTEGAPALLGLAEMSKSLYQDLANENNSFGFSEAGLLMLFQSDKKGKEEREAAKLAVSLGLDARELNSDDISSIETLAKPSAIGGVYYSGDAYMRPQDLMGFFKAELETLNVRVRKGFAVSSMITEKGRVVGCKSEHEVEYGDCFVLAAGSWSPVIAKQLGIQLRILPGKGYSFNSASDDTSPSVPTILCEGKVAITPMGETTRIGGTLEITTLKDRRINMNRIEGIVNSVNQFYPDWQQQVPPRSYIWKGFRPCTPTGLPLIHQSRKYSNLIVATGHAMLGVTLATGTGKVVEELISEKKTSIDISKFGELIR